MSAKTFCLWLFLSSATIGRHSRQSSRCSAQNVKRLTYYWKWYFQEYQPPWRLRRYSHFCNILLNLFILSRSTRSVGYVNASDTLLEFIFKIIAFNVSQQGVSRINSETLKCNTHFLHYIAIGWTCFHKIGLCGACCIYIQYIWGHTNCGNFADSWSARGGRGMRPAVNVIPRPAASQALPRPVRLLLQHVLCSRGRRGLETATQFDVVQNVA